MQNSNSKKECALTISLTPPSREKGESHSKIFSLVPFVRGAMEKTKLKKKRPHSLLSSRLKKKRGRRALRRSDQLARRQKEYKTERKKEKKGGPPASTSPNSCPKRERAKGRAGPLCSILLSTLRGRGRSTGLASSLLSTSLWGKRTKKLSFS